MKGKHYKDWGDFQSRKELFVRADQHIKEENAHSDHHFIVDHNETSDLTDEEFEAMLNPMVADDQEQADVISFLTPDYVRPEHLAQVEKVKSMNLA